MTSTSKLDATALLGSLLFLGTSCGTSEIIPDPDHCYNNGGDSYCARLFPEAPLCSSSLGSCPVGTQFGCFAELSEVCSAPCGQDVTDECVEAGSGNPSTGETNTGTAGDPTVTTTGPTDTEDTSESSTTTGPRCIEDSECNDAAAPGCQGDACVACNLDDAPDMACASLGAGTDLCDDGNCVQCTDENDAACVDTTPVCEGGACRGCAFHAECGTLGAVACHIDSGSCITEPGDITEINLGNVDDLQSLIDAVAPGEPHAFVLNANVDADVSITGGRIIAFVGPFSSYDNFPVIGGDDSDGTPNLAVSGDGSVAYLHRVKVQDGGSDLGVSVDGATLYADESAVVNNGGGGISATGAEVYLRNVFVSGQPDTAPALSLLNSTTSVLYSTLGLGPNFGDPVISCADPGATTLRNSTVVSRTSSSRTAIACAGITESNNFVREEQVLGAWFTDFNLGDYRLMGADTGDLSGIAQWQPGDPPTDIDGDPRPATAGPDYAGADLP